jgi:ketosteroid isomerase-like protein
MGSRIRHVTAALLVASALVAAGCGGESDQELVRQAVADYGDASAEKDYQRICDELVAKDLLRSVESVGLPCELAFKRGLQDVQEPKVEVGDVTINKSKALVEVRSTAKGQPPSQDTLELTLEGGDWRISSLAKAQPQPPAGAAP